MEPVLIRKHSAVVLYTVLNQSEITFHHKQPKSKILKQEMRSVFLDTILFLKLFYKIIAFLNNLYTLYIYIDPYFHQQTSEVLSTRLGFFITVTNKRSDCVCERNIRTRQRTERKEHVRETQIITET